MRINYLIFLLISALLACPSRIALAGEDALVEQSVEFNGAFRSYYLHVPPDLRQAGGRVPLVIVLHGGGSNGKAFANKTRFTAKADEEHFIVVYPNGTSGVFGLNTWNAVHCCAYAMKRRIDDLGFINVLIDQLVQELPVDTRRVYVTGASNGGMLTHRIGIALSEKIAAIAPVIATLFGDEPLPPIAVPALIINGNIDETVAPEGGKVISLGSDGSLLKPTAYQGQFWAVANGCNPQPQEQRPTSTWPVAVWTYSCPRGREVVRMLVMDNGHAWPGGLRGERRAADTPSLVINATDVIWDFFKNYSR